MTDIYIVHLSEKKKKIVKQCENENEVIQFITAINKGSSYLKNNTFESFEYNDDECDGVYVVKDGDFVKVFKLETLCLTGYLYNSIYKVRRCLNSYELIEAEKEL